MQRVQIARALARVQAAGVGSTSALDAENEGKPSFEWPMSGRGVFASLISGGEFMG